MQDRREQHGCKDREGRIGQRRDGNRDDGDAGNKAFGSGGVNQPAAGHLPGQRDKPGYRQNQTDIGLCPFLCSQIDREERSKSGLDVGDAEDEPVETAKAALRRRGRHIARRRRLWHNRQLPPVLARWRFGRSSLRGAKRRFRGQRYLPDVPVVT